MYRHPAMHRLLARTFWIGLVGVLAFGQESGGEAAARIEARIAALRIGGEEGREALVETYEQALAALARAAEFRERAEGFRAETEEAPGLVEALRAELAEVPEELRLEPDPALSLLQIEGLLGQAQADLAAGRAQLAELDGIAQHRSKRRGELPGEIAATQNALAAEHEALAALPEVAENEARRALISAQVEELQAKADLLEAERLTYEARRELLPLRRDRAVRDVGRAERVASFWTEQVDARRAEEGEAAARDATQRMQEITGRFPALAELAATTRELTALRTGEGGLPKRISRAQAELEVTRAKVDEVRARFQSARRRVTAGGLTEGMGLILRRDYEWLPKANVLNRESAVRDRMLSEAQLELIVTEEGRREVGDLAVATEQLVQELRPDAPDEAFRAAARELLGTQREARDAALAGLETLTSAFYEHKELTQTLIQESFKYRAFIERHILWVRSAAANPLPSLMAAPACAARVAQEFWSPKTLEGMREQAVKRWPRVLVAGLFLLALLALRGRLAARRLALAGEVRSFRTDKYSHTLLALAQSLLLALPVPLVFWTAGTLLAPSADELARASGLALMEISLVWLALRLLRELAAEKSVGSAHFKWPANSMKALRKELAWFEPVVVLLGFCALALNGQPTAEWADSVGRIAFVGAMIALAVFGRRLLRAGSPMWSIAPHVGRGLLGRTHAIWSLLAYGIPAALALLALAGFYYTAIQFELRLRYSIGFALALVMVNALLLRWLFMTRRRLAVRQALEARARKEQEEEAVEGGVEPAPAALDADKVDIPAIDAQTRKLFKASITVATVVGLYFIWANVFPALQGLDRVQLLPRLAIVSAEPQLTEAELPVGSATPQGSGGTGQALPSPPIRAIVESQDAPASDEGASGQLGLPVKLTLADVLLAIAFAVLTSVAARNLPALLELAVLQRLPLDGGSRYAVTTIVRYLILIIGVTVTTGALGIGWQKVQWLAAALTFGLAFGLQEIFANFVSGLIILVERPVRVGDVVTVGDTEGRVTQLRMRATTIMDWNRREYLIPNKEFITGSVINWTLSDPITRIIIPVGIAYGSDTSKARKLLLEAARKNSIVLDDPEPCAVFRAFGASSLDFELRVFVGNRDLWPEVIDRLHTQIDDSFRKAGIEIAFPQQDVHLRSVEGLKEVQLRADDDE